VIHLGIGLRQLFHPVLLCERKPRRLEARLRFIDGFGITERRSGKAHGDRPQLDRRRALAGVADAADHLAVLGRVRMYPPSLMQFAKHSDYDRPQ
jgi:hypothetical protein